MKSFARPGVLLCLAPMLTAPDTSGDARATTALHNASATPCPYIVAYYHTLLTPKN